MVTFGHLTLNVAKARPGCGVDAARGARYAAK